MSDSTGDPFDRSSNLYHYTSAQVWTASWHPSASGQLILLFLNDWREINYAAEPLMERLEAYLAGHAPAELTDVAASGQSTKIA